MYRKYLRLATLLVGGAAMAGCQTMTQEQQDQATGAAVGGAIGAFTCLFGDCDPSDFLIRAAAGAAVGWGAIKINQVYSEQTASASEEAEAFSYTPTEGTVIRLQNVAIEPEFSRGGEELIFSMEYTVLAPPDTSTVPVTERWMILKDGAMQIELDNGTHERDQGRWVSRASIELPAEIEAGTYIVKSEVSTGSRYDVQQVAFYVGVD